MLQKHSRGVGVVFLKGLYISPAGVLIDRRVLVELLSLSLAHQTGRGNVFHIDLYSLSGIAHLFIRLRKVFGVGRLSRHDTQPSENTIQTGNGTRIAALQELYPEDDKACMRISAAHIRDELELLRSVLVGMAVRTARTAAQRIQGTVIAIFPAIDVLPVYAIPDCSLGDSVFLSIMNKR